MAQVPRNDGFSVMPNERAAFQGTQFIDPGIKVDAPDFSKAADRLDKAQTKIYEEIDTARTTAQVSELKRFAYDRRRAFLNLKGALATEPDKDGRSLMDREDAELQKRAEQLKANLTPRQQRLFDKEAGEIFSSQYGMASEHVRQENYNFMVGSQTGKRDLAIQTAVGNYNDPLTLERSRKDIAASEAELGRIKGLSKEEVAVNTNKATSMMYRGTIEASLQEAIGDPVKAKYADKLLKENSKYMLPADVAACRKVIDTHLDVVSANELEIAVTSHDTFVERGSADYTSNAVVNGKVPTEKELRTTASQIFFGGMTNAISGGRHKGDDGNIAVNKIGGEENKDKWQYGYSMLSVPKAMKAAKRMGLEFNEKDFHDNEGYNAMLGNAYFGDMIVAYAGDEDKAAAAYYGSEEEVNKAVEAATKEGNPADWLKHMDANTQAAVTNIRNSIKKSREFEFHDEKGNKISADTPQYVDAKMGAMFITREEVRQRLLATDERCRRDPAWLEARLDGAMRRVDQQKADYRQKQINNMVEAKTALFAAGGRFEDIPPAVLAKLDTNQQDALRELAKKISIDDQSTDDEVFYRVFGNDELLKAMPKGEFALLQGTVSGQKWEMLKKKYNELQNEKVAAQDQLATGRKAAEAGQVLAPYDKMTLAEVKTEVRNAMGEAFDDLDTDDQEMLIGRLRYTLALEGQAGGVNLHGKPMTLSERIRTHLGQQTIVSGFWSNKRKSIALLKASDFKNRGDTDAQNILREIARRSIAHHQGPDSFAAKREPNEREINEAIREVFMSKNLPYALSGLKMSEPLVKHVKETYRKQKGHEPSSGDVVRMYLLFCASGEKLPYKVASYGDIGMPVENTSDDFFGDILTPPTDEKNDDYYHGIKAGSYK